MKKKSKVLSVTNNKGGVGKTSLAFHLFHYAIEKALEELEKKEEVTQRTLPVYISLDTQKSTRSIFDDDRILILDTYDLFIKEKTDYFINILKAEFLNNRPVAFVGDGRIDDTTKEQQRQFLINVDTINKFIGSDSNLIVVDLPPTEGFLMKLGLLIADKVIIPFQLDVLSVDGIDSIVKLIIQAKKQREEAGFDSLELMGIVPNMYMKKSKEQRENLINILNSLKKLFLYYEKDGKKMPLLIPHTVQMQRALERRKPLWEVEGKGKANPEVMQALNVIFNNMMEV